MLDGEVDEPKVRVNRKEDLSHTRIWMSVCVSHEHPKELLDDHRALEPPDPIPNSAVKRRIADGSVGFPHVRVGHRQAPIPKPPISLAGRGFCFWGAESRGDPIHAIAFPL